MYCYGAQLWASCSFTIEVPQELLEKKSSLIIYMLDSNGNQCIGKCQLDSSHLSRKISQNELQLATCEEANRFDTVVDLMVPQTGSANVVVLHFEFDSSVRILRMLVVKESLLEENPFDVLTVDQTSFEVMHHEFSEFENDFDALSDLVANVDSAAMDKSIERQEQQSSRLGQYMLYAEIYMLMQYGRMKRIVNDVTSWFSGSN